MSLLPRHRYIIRILHRTFYAPHNLPQMACENAIQSRAVLSTIDYFLSTAKRNKNLFFFYFPPMEDGLRCQQNGDEYDESNDDAYRDSFKHFFFQSESYYNNDDDDDEDTMTTAAGTEREGYLVTTPHHNVAWGRRRVYFTKSFTETGTIDPLVSNDDALIYGMSGQTSSPLMSDDAIVIVIRHVYMPLLCHLVNDSFFKRDMARCIRIMQDMYQSIFVVPLVRQRRHDDKNHCYEHDDEVFMDRHRVTVYTHFLQLWSKRISHFLSKLEETRFDYNTTTTISKGNASLNKAQKRQKQRQDLSEGQHWTRRAAQLRSLLHCMTTSQCRDIIDTVAAECVKPNATVFPVDEHKEKCHGIVVSWRQLRKRLAERLNEVTNYSTMLTDLEGTYFDVLENCNDVGEAVVLMPAFFRALREVFTREYYYAGNCGSRRIVAMLSRVTQLVLRTCARFVLISGNDNDKNDGIISPKTKEEQTPRWHDNSCDYCPNGNEESPNGKEDRNATPLTRLTSCLLVVDTYKKQNDNLRDYILETCPCRWHCDSKTEDAILVQPLEALRRGIHSVMFVCELRNEVYHFIMKKRKQNTRNQSRTEEEYLRQMESALRDVMAVMPRPDCHNNNVDDAYSSLLIFDTHVQKCRERVSVITAEWSHTISHAILLSCHSIAHSQRLYDRMVAVPMFLQQRHYPVHNAVTTAALSYQNHQMSSCYQQHSAADNKESPSSYKHHADSLCHKLLQKYVNQVNHVISVYDRYKDAPPCGRNTPPVSAAISWSRHLLLRVNEPLLWFEARFAGNDRRENDAGRCELSNRHSILEWRDLRKQCHKLINALVVFERLWLGTIWVQNVGNVLASLDASILLPITPPKDLSTSSSSHQGHETLAINFDPAVSRLIRDAVCLRRRHGVTLSPKVQTLVVQEERWNNIVFTLKPLLRQYHDELSFCRDCDDDDDSKDKVANTGCSFGRNATIAVVAPLLKQLLKAVTKGFRPFLTHLTWKSSDEVIVAQIQKIQEYFSLMVEFKKTLLDDKLKSAKRIVTTTLRHKCLLPQRKDDKKPKAPFPFRSICQFTQYYDVMISNAEQYFVDKSQELQLVVTDIERYVNSFWLQHSNILKDHDNNDKSKTTAKVIAPPSCCIAVMKQLRRGIHHGLVVALLHSVRTSLRHFILQQIAGRNDNDITINDKKNKPLFELEARTSPQTNCYSPPLPNVEKSLRNVVKKLSSCYYKALRPWEGGNDVVVRKLRQRFNVEVVVLSLIMECCMQRAAASVREVCRTKLKRWDWIWEPPSLQSDALEEEGHNGNGDSEEERNGGEEESGLLLLEKRNQIEDDIEGCLEECIVVGHVALQTRTLKWQLLDELRRK